MTDQQQFAPGPQSGWQLNDAHTDADPINAAGLRIDPAEATMDKAQFLRECGVTSARPAS